jgi:Flp pilus assembly protein TadG
MLLILLGTIDMGRMFFEYIDLRGAVREGVTAAARADCATANSVAQTAVLAHSEDLNDGGTIVSPVTYSPSCPTSYDDPTTTVTLTANRSFQPIFTEFLDIYFGLGGAINMEASASAKVWT